MILPVLNLPEYSFKFKQLNNRNCIFDTIRKKYVVLNPEEWVRQNFIQFLISEKNYPASLIAIEVGLKYNQLQKRADILIYHNGLPDILVECKAPEIKISQNTLDQIARYNMSLKVNHLIVTNGMEHFCCKMNYVDNSYQFLKSIPDFM